MRFTQEYARLRRNSNLSQIELQNKLKERGHAVTLQRLSKWENGHGLPNLDEFFALCDIFHIHNPAEYFSDYWKPQLNHIGLQKVQDYREDLISSGRYCPCSETTRALPIYLLPASAGSGQFLDSDDFELVDAGPDVPAKADFGIRIAGDSMEPRFYDGQTVWVHKCDSLENGDIGVFYLDGDSYIKQFRNADNEIALISINKKYDPIHIDANSDFRVFGRVLK